MSVPEWYGIRERIHGMDMSAYLYARFCDRVSQPELTQLFRCGHSARYRAGQPLMGEGEPGDYVVIIRSGQVKVLVRDERGNDHLLGVRGPGELLGEMACIEDRARSATVLAHSQVVGIKIPKTAFLDFVVRHPRTALEVGRQAMIRLRAVERRQTQLVSRDVGTRLVRVLAEMSAVFVAGPDAREVEIPLSHDELAQLAFVAKVSVQRKLRLLRERRLVTTRYGKVVVPCLSCFRHSAMAVAEGRKSSNVIMGCNGVGNCHLT